MTHNFEDLEQASPHLQGVLKRSFPVECKLKHASFETVRKAFSVAYRSAANQEIDIVRDPEVSFNPRPARITLIAIHDGLISSLGQLEALLYYLALESSDELTIDLAEIEPTTLADVQLLSTELEELRQSTNAQLAWVKTCHAAIWLDRVRHLHQASNERLHEVGKEVYDQTDLYIELVDGQANPLAKMLRAWKDRFRRILLKLHANN